MGVTEKDLEGYNDLVKQSFHLVNGTIPEITKARMQEVVKT